MQGNNGSVEAAINEFFDNPSSSRYQQVRYDASHWGTDRDGSGGADIRELHQSPSALPYLYLHLLP